MKKRKKGFWGLALVAIIISAWYFCCWESTDSLPQEVQEAAQHASWSELKRRAVVDEEQYLEGRPSKIELVYNEKFKGVSLEVYQVVTELSYISEDSTIKWKELPYADTMIFRVNGNKRELLGIDNTDYTPDSKEFEQLLNMYLLNSNSP